MQVITEIGSAAEIPQQQLEQLTHFLPRYGDGGPHVSHAHICTVHSTSLSCNISWRLQLPMVSTLYCVSCSDRIPPVIKELKNIIKWPIRGYFWAHDLEVYLGHELLISSLELLPIYWPVWYR